MKNKKCPHCYKDVSSFIKQTLQSQLDEIIGEYKEKMGIHENLKKQYNLEANEEAVFLATAKIEVFQDLIKSLKARSSEL